VPDSSFELGKLRCLHLRACTLHQLLWKSGTQRRELPEATENGSQVQVGQRGRIAVKLRLEDSSGPTGASFCRLQSLAQEQSRIVYRVHQSRGRGRPRSDSDPSKRGPRGREANPLHERANGVERGEDYSRGCDADRRSTRARNDRKQAAPKKGLFDDWSKQPVEENQVPKVDHVSGWSRGTSNDVDPNSKPDPAEYSGNQMNSTRPNPSEKGPDLVSMSEPYDRVQRADE